MLQLFRNNTPYTVVILFIFTLLVKLQALVHPVAPVLLPDSQAYNMLANLFGTVLGRNGFGFTMLTVVLLFGQGIYLVAITAKHRLFVKTSYLPAFAYIALTALLPDFNFFSPQLIVNWLMLAAFDIFLRFTQPQSPRKYIFNAGFLLALAAIVQSSALCYILLFLIVLVILRPFNPSEWMVGLMGYLTPVYFLAGILYLAGHLNEMRNLIHVGISLPQQVPHPRHLIGSVVGILVLLSAGLYVMNDSRSRQAISVRRAWTSAVLWFVIAIPVCIFTPKGQPAAWLCMMPPLALLTSQPLVLEKSKRFSNFVFYFFIILIVFCQFTVHK